MVSATVQRDRLALAFALVTLAGAGAVFLVSEGRTFLMPGPLTSAHGSIETCDSCHTKSGTSKVSWVHGLVAGDPLADSKACLTCHKMPDTAFNAHSAKPEILKRSTDRLTKIAVQTSVPLSARAQSIAFPTKEIVARDLYCATCHQEHQGADFKLSKISNEQCRSCHTVQFDNFDGQHPKFDSYPFTRRTKIAYDHAAHFGKHYPEVAKKEPAKQIPETCSTCHSSRDDKRIMAVVPFEKTCATCHLDQITGKTRAQGPKGIALLSLPGLDLESLQKKNAAMGEWPDASEAALTPFMKVMLSQNEQGRALVKTVDSLNLQDLAKASDDEIKSVTALVWEIKTLFHTLISGKASDALGAFNLGEAKLSPQLVTDLTAGLPRDVLLSAQQEWLPSLATEIASRKAGVEVKGSWGSTPEPSSQAAVSKSDSTPESPAEKADADEPPEQASEAGDAAASDEGQADEPKPAKTVERDPPACLVRVLGQCLVSKDDNQRADTEPDKSVGLTDTNRQKAADKSADPGLPPPMRAGLSDVAKAALAQIPATRSDQIRVAENQPAAKLATQNDELLSPTADELREINSRRKSTGRKGSSLDAGIGKPDAGAPAEAGDESPTKGSPEITIGSDVDPESWADAGGWYRQDYAIFYRPTGHKDKFLYSWLFLTGPLAPRDQTTPQSAVFNSLTHKDAQGACTKCHSIDDLDGKGRMVNFAPLKPDSKSGHFTTFIHEPHFGIMEDRGCLTCHKLDKDQPFLKSYEQGNPQTFASNFGPVKKDLCQTCHNSTMARQDCLTCHKYHLDGVMTPVMSTKLPIQ